MCACINCSPVQWLNTKLIPDRGRHQAEERAGWIGRTHLREGGREGGRGGREGREVETGKGEREEGNEGGKQGGGEEGKEGGRREWEIVN